MTKKSYSHSVHWTITAGMFLTVCIVSDTMWTRSQIARFTWPTWGPPGADIAPWILLSGIQYAWRNMHLIMFHFVMLELPLITDEFDLSHLVSQGCPSVIVALMCDRDGILKDMGKLGWHKFNHVQGGANRLHISWKNVPADVISPGSST